MKITSLAISDVVTFEPRTFSDERGYFFEYYNEAIFKNAIGQGIHFYQDNQSHSKAGVIRGLHYQLEPMGQGKLVRVTAGAAFDVAVDIRRKSPTFGKWVGQVLSAENRLQMWIPAGFAHGFMALTEGVDFQYKVTAPYSASHERCIRWDDPTISINWPDSVKPILSAKDAEGRHFKDADLFD